MEISYWLIIYFLLAYAGMFVHFAKKDIKGETATDIKLYFSDHFKSTLTAFIVTTVATAGYLAELKTGTSVDYIACFTGGYMFDSMLNKWEAKGV